MVCALKNAMGAGDILALRFCRRGVQVGITVSAKLVLGIVPLFVLIELVP